MSVYTLLSELVSRAVFLPFFISCLCFIARIRVGFDESLIFSLAVFEENI